MAAVDACETVAAKVRDAEAAVAEFDAQIAQARAALAEAETSAESEAPVEEGDEVPAGEAEGAGPARHRFGTKLFSGRRHEGGGGGVALSDRPAADESDLPAEAADEGSPPGGEGDERPGPPPAESGDEDAQRLSRLEARRVEADDELESLGVAGPTNAIRTARDHLAGLGPEPTDPEVERARSLSNRWRELTRELDALGWRQLGDEDDATSVAERARVAAPTAAASLADSGSDESDASPEPVEPDEVVDARARLIKARKNREVAQAALRSATAGPDDVSALEAAHNAVLDAQERCRGPVRRGQGAAEAGGGPGRGARRPRPARLQHVRRLHDERHGSLPRRCRHRGPRHR